MDIERFMMQKQREEFSTKLDNDAKTGRNGMRAMNFEHMIGRDTEKGIIIIDPKEEIRHAANHQSDHIRTERQRTRVQHTSRRK
ncbi:hypothetical protein A0I97_09010 [Listeria monocytogenes]|nr:hypothetical protein [Listeria monocytogenes]PDR00304.1 hypothetical protein A0I97_09010 [Listeria monocytogenes]